jgi:hypothetical protein
MRAVTIYTMRFSIKPAGSSLHITLETAQYKNIWAQNSRVLLKAWRNVTSLEFQQPHITARVFDGQQSNAGRYRHPMLLAGDGRSASNKLMTIVHELSHRLLGGNCLGLINLGLIGDDDTSDLAVELHHRHIYIFEYDVMTLAFGEHGANICRNYEQRNHTGTDDPYRKAWEWAMGLSYEQRQNIMRWFASKKVTRDKWHEVPFEDISRTDIGKWLQKLDSAAGQGS